MAKHKNKQSLESAPLFPLLQPCASVALFARLAYALSDASRLRALLALRDKEQCVCRITELLALAPSTVSKHMAVLRDAGLVQSRKEGRWIYYRLPDKPRHPAIQGTLKLLSLCTACDPVVAQDLSTLKTICCRPPRSKGGDS